MSIEDFLSPERLAPYRKAPSDTQQVILARYMWNVELCSAFYVPLHLVEVGLRNTLDRILSRRVDNDWLTRIGVLAPGEVKSVQNALDKLAKEREPQTKGKIIAELNFGFWAALFYRKYENSPKYSPANPPRNAIIWPTHIKEVVPYAPKWKQNIKDISTQVEEIRKFRNRVFHHEPIWHLNRLEDYDRHICEMVEWITPDAMQLLQRSRVKSTLLQKPP